MMVSQALDTLTSMSATARLQQSNKLCQALIINFDVKIWICLFTGAVLLEKQAV